MTSEEHGIMPAQHIREAIRKGWLTSGGGAIPPGNIQPASLDLRLGGVAHRLRCSFLPNGLTVEERLADLSMGSISLDQGAALEVNRPYLAPLMEQLDLPEDVRARANPRSSTGRLDIFTRVITDSSREFDNISPGYRGPMYLEIVSRSFTIQVTTGVSLNQIRLIRGNPAIPPEELIEHHHRDALVLLDGEPKRLELPDLRGGMPLGVDLRGVNGGGMAGGGMVGYRVRRNTRLLDLTRTHPAADFWEPVQAEPGGRLVLEPEEFYILASRESVRIPPGLAAEMVALDPTSGEFRAHYAGFFDPGFGYGAEQTRAVMEVRAHDVPFMLEHGQRVCRLEFERLLAPPEITYGAGAGSHYQGQHIQLSKQFRQ